MQYVIALLVLIALLVGGFALLNRPHFVPIQADIPADFPADGFAHFVAFRDYDWALNNAE